VPTTLIPVKDKTNDLCLAVVARRLAELCELNGGCPGVQEAEVDLVMGVVNYTTQIHLPHSLATLLVFLKAANFCELPSSLAAIG
jgi:hypothetical protein